MQAATVAAAAAETQLQQNAPAAAATTTTPGQLDVEFRVPRCIVVASISLALATTAQPT